MPAARKPAPLRAFTPIAFAVSIVQAYRRQGINPQPALQKARIAPALLNRPSARITAVQLQELASAAMQELDDEALGWFSRRLPWGSHGLLCRASLTAPTLGVALKRWCRHYALLTDDLRFTLEAGGPVVTLALEERRDFAELREFCLLTCLRNVHGYASWLIDSRLGLQAVGFPFAAPPHHEVYPVLFPGPVHFNAPRASFSFDARYLDLPIHRDERALQRMLQNALSLTVRQYRRDRLVTQRIRQALLDAPAVDLEVEAMAVLLHMSARTLHRQLSEEGTSFQQLKDTVRRERAMHLLTRTAQPVKQVAAACGFDNAKSFARAFRQWTGMSPSEARGESG